MSLWYVYWTPEVSHCSDNDQYTIIYTIHPYHACIVSVTTLEHVPWTGSNCYSVLSHSDSHTYSCLNSATTMAPKRQKTKDPTSNNASLVDHTSSKPKHRQRDQLDPSQIIEGRRCRTPSSRLREAASSKPTSASSSKGAAHFRVRRSLYSQTPVVAPVLDSQENDLDKVLDLDLLEPVPEDPKDDLFRLETINEEEDIMDETLSQNEEDEQPDTSDTELEETTKHVNKGKANNAREKVPTCEYRLF
jgi:hypothetical protein